MPILVHAHYGGLGRRLVTEAGVSIGQACCCGCDFGFCSDEGDVSSPSSCDALCALFSSSACPVMPPPVMPPCGADNSVTVSCVSPPPTSTPTHTATSTPTPTPSDTPTATPTATLTATPVPEGGPCMDTAQCEPGLACVNDICSDGVMVPTTSRTGLFVLAALLALVGVLVLWRRREPKHYLWSVQRTVSSCKFETPSSTETV